MAQLFSARVSVERDEVHHLRTHQHCVIDSSSLVRNAGKPCRFHRFSCAYTGYVTPGTFNPESPQTPLSAGLERVNDTMQPTVRTDKSNTDSIAGCEGIRHTVTTTLSTSAVVLTQRFLHDYEGNTVCTLFRNAQQLLHRESMLSFR